MTMKKIYTLFFVFVVNASFGQYANFTQSLNFPYDFINSYSGGGSAGISITNNVLTVSINGGFATNQLKTGIIKYLSITPPAYILFRAGSNYGKKYFWGWLFILIGLFCKDCK